MAVEVAAGAVIVLGGAGVGVPSQDLRVPKRDAHVEGVGGRGGAVGSPRRWAGTVIGMVAGLLPLPTACSTRYPRSVSA